jgi:hypothetical protein
MAELLVEFCPPIRADDGTNWYPRVWGAMADDNLWEGWIEYLPAGTEERDSIRTGRETEQPKRSDLMYWAQGLTQVYLEGALQRALRNVTRASASDASSATLANPLPQAESEVRAIRSRRR